MTEEDAEPALAALEKAGMIRFMPPEDWPVKAFDDDVLVDLIFRLNQRPVTEEVLGKATNLRIGPTAALVSAAPI